MSINHLKPITTGDHAWQSRQNLALRLDTSPGEIRRAWEQRQEGIEADWPIERKRRDDGPDQWRVRPVYQWVTVGAMSDAMGYQSRFNSQHFPGDRGCVIELNGCRIAREATDAEGGTRRWSYALVDDDYRHPPNTTRPLGVVIVRVGNERRGQVTVYADSYDNSVWDGFYGPQFGRSRAEVLLEARGVRAEWEREQREEVAA